MDSAESNTAETFLLSQESRRTYARCGEQTSWAAQENLEAAIQFITDFECFEETRHIVIPNDPTILLTLMRQMHARVIEQCGGSA